ncbi:MlaD family protein [Thermodesulfobacteriota bacterium]
MASIKTKLTVGIFVIIGFSIAAVAVLWLGFYTQIAKGQFYTAYFDESVQGLNKDSPVKYRGVSVGRVDSVGVAPDSTLVQAILKIETGLKLDENIVAQIKSVGITGIMFVELDRKIKGEPNLSPAIGFPSKYPVVATKPSEIQQLFSHLNEALNQIKTLNFKDVSDKMQLALDNINQTIDDAQIKQISSEVRSTLMKIEKAMDSAKRIGSSFNTFAKNADDTVLNMNNTVLRIDRIVAENEAVFKKAIDDLGTSVENANLFLEKGTKLVTDSNDRFSTLQRHLLISLKSIEQASENLNRLVDLISDRPSRLIFGEPPPERKVEPNR